MSLEAFEAAGLYDPAAPRAAQRKELLDHLTARFGVEPVIAHDGRLVKLIGDEAMIVADDVGAACRIACELCAHAEADPDLPQARGAVGFGEVTARGGDYFGPVVNLVARAVAEAPPGSVVVVDGAEADLGDGWSPDPLPAVCLRGVPAPVPLAVVRLQPS